MCPCMCVCVCVRERERERDRQTDRQTDRDRQTERQRQTDRHRHRQRDRQTDRDRECVYLSVCLPVLDREGSWVFASTALAVIRTVVHRTGHSDGLTGFHEPCLPLTDEKCLARSLDERYPIINYNYPDARTPPLLQCFDQFVIRKHGGARKFERC